MNSPSQELARKIMARLIAVKLVTAEDAQKLAVKLAEGKLNGADWKLAIEKGRDREARE